MPSHLIHPLEWVPVLALLLILSNVFPAPYANQPTETVPNNQDLAATLQHQLEKSFQEANGKYGVQKLVLEHCRGDAKAVCAVPLRGGPGDSARCSSSFTQDHAFFSLLDTHMDFTRCRLSIPISSQHDHENVAQDFIAATAPELLLDLLFKEIYDFASVYFRTISPTTTNNGHSRQMVNQEGLGRFLALQLGSWLDFVSLSSSSPSSLSTSSQQPYQEGDSSSTPKSLVIIVPTPTTTTTSTSTSMPLEQQSVHDNLELLLHYTTWHKKQRSKSAISHSAQEPMGMTQVMMDNHNLDHHLNQDDEFGRFFWETVEHFMERPRRIPPLTLPTKLQPQVTEDLDLSNCLWAYQDRNWLVVSDRCEPAMEQATIRLHELSSSPSSSSVLSQQSFHQQQQHHDFGDSRRTPTTTTTTTTSSSSTTTERNHQHHRYHGAQRISIGFQRGFYGLTWVFCLALLWEVFWFPNNKELVLKRSRQCLTIHFLLSGGLWWYHPRSRLFASATILGLTTYLTTFFLNRVLVGGHLDYGNEGIVWLTKNSLSGSLLLGGMVDIPNFAVFAAKSDASSAESVSSSEFSCELATFGNDDR